MFILVLLAVFVACGSQPEVQQVEVTRITTETVMEDVEGEPVEVEATRLVVEAVGEEAGEGSPYVPTDTKTETGRDSTGWIDASGSSDEFAARAEVDDMEGAEEMAAYAPAAGEGVAAEPPPALDGDARVGAPAAVAGASLNQNSTMSASEVDDNAQWDDYLLYLKNYQSGDVLQVNVLERHQIFVQDANSQPILGARVDFLDPQTKQSVYSLRTHSDGRVYFFPLALPANQQLNSYEVQVTVDGRVLPNTLTLTSGGSQREWFVMDSEAQQPAQMTNLDVLFLIDTTGSMSDEIQQLKENIEFIALKVSEMGLPVNIRFGMTVYRDRGDEYVSRTFEFTPDVKFFAEGLNQVTAGGGGDYPEDLNEGLYKAVHVPEWRVEDTISLMFLVADAPPQLGYQDQTSNYAIEMQEAARRGIKIYPIASSGLDPQGEYVFRQLAQFTGGRFLFLTYGAGGAGSTGTETTMSVDDYDVTSLDGLVIRIIEEELAHRSPQ
jgi:hypothetical protein